MKFIIKDENLIIEEMEEQTVSNTINYYQAKVEYNETWEGLTIVAKFIKHNETIGEEKPVFLNNVQYDMDLDGTYLVGFVGYTLNENNEKEFQICTILKPIIFTKGAGKIKTKVKEVPVSSEWEQYIAQIQEIIKNSGGSGGGGIAKETDPTVPEHVKNITEEEIKKWNNGTGGTGGKDEIYVGEEEPTDEDVEVWIDPNGEADNFATEEYVDKKISEAQLSGGEIDTSGFAKVEDIPDVSEFVTQDDVDTAIQNALEVVENGTY